MSAVRFWVTGAVQGVGFRWFVARHSRQLGLHGHARNLSDGRVEVVVTGPDEGLAALEELLKVGPEHAKVTNVEKSEISGDEILYKSFEIM
ncbi:MAG: acylphosphatase [Gemmatimonadales bacterium]